MMEVLNMTNILRTTVIDSVKYDQQPEDYSDWHC